MDVISLLLLALVLLIVIYVVLRVIEVIPLPDNIKQIVYLIAGVIFLLALLHRPALFANLRL